MEEGREREKEARGKEGGDREGAVRERERIRETSSLTSLIQAKKIKRSWDTSKCRLQLLASDKELTPAV
jgi:hypothetical protein